MITCCFYMINKRLNIRSVVSTQWKPPFHSLEATFPPSGNHLSTHWKQPFRPVERMLAMPTTLSPAFKPYFSTLKTIIFPHFATKTKGISAVVANKRARHHKRKRKATKCLEHHHFAPYLCNVERNKTFPETKNN